jgi:hypothetical protein
MSPRADAVQVQVGLRRAFDRSPLRRWERVGGPHRPRGPPRADHRGGGVAAADMELCISPGGQGGADDEDHGGVAGHQRDAGRYRA